MLSYEELRDAIAGKDNQRAVIQITSRHQPVGGEGATVAPPTFAGIGYLRDTRYRSDGEACEVVHIDTVQSQSNCAEKAMLAASQHDRCQIAIPLFALSFAPGDGRDERVLTSLEFPHRYADAYFRDSLAVNDDDSTESFQQSEVGKAMLRATQRDATALLVHSPDSLVYGSWYTRADVTRADGGGTKFPRIYCSRMLGWEPLTARHAGMRYDPHNLVGGWQASAAAGASAEAGAGWSFQSGSTSEKKKLSTIGHGHILFPDMKKDEGRLDLGGVSVRYVSRSATISLTGLRNIGFGAVDTATQDAARAYLAAYALLADRLAFTQGTLWLRSGCELITERACVQWLGADGSASDFCLDVGGAHALFRDAEQALADKGVERRNSTARLRPNAALQQALMATYDYSTFGEDEADSKKAG